MADQVPHERRARVARSAQHTRGHDLQPVGELEQRGNREKRHTGGDGRRRPMVNRRMTLRGISSSTTAARAHENGGEKKRGPAGANRGVGVPPAQRLSHAYRACG